MSTKQEIVSCATFKAWLFSSDFKLASKGGKVTAATCKYYGCKPCHYPLLQRALS